MLFIIRYQPMLFKGIGKGVCNQTVAKGPRMKGIVPKPIGIGSIRKKGFHQFDHRNALFFCETFGIWIDGVNLNNFLHVLGIAWRNVRFLYGLNRS